MPPGVSISALERPQTGVGIVIEACDQNVDPMTGGRRVGALLNERDRIRPKAIGQANLMAKRFCHLRAAKFVERYSCRLACELR